MTDDLVTNTDPDPEDTPGILAKTINEMIAGVTGLASSKREELFLSAGHVLQRIRVFGFLGALMSEWQTLVEKGRVKQDYAQSEQHRACLQEMLDFLDNDLPDEMRFAYLKKILMVAATEEKSERTSVLPQQYMQLARRLTSGEVLVLTTTYRRAKSGGYDSKTHVGADTWLKRIASDSGLRHSELVELHERELMEKQLLTPRKYSDKSGVSVAGRFRLSGLGWELCEFVEFYDDVIGRDA